MKRILPLTIGLIVGILLSSCALGAPSTPAPARSVPPTGVVTIGFATLSSLRPLYEPVIASFNAANPDVQVQFVAIDEVLPRDTIGSLTQEQILRRQFSAADTLDLSFFDPTAIPDYLLDLTPLMDADPDFNRDDFYPRAFAPVEDDAANLVLPHTLRLGLLAYNQDLWAANDLPAPTPDWTWNDLTAFAQALAVQRGEGGQVYGLLPPRSAVDLLVAELEARGSDLFSTPLEQVRLDTSEIAAALEQVAAFGESGAFYLPTAGHTEDVNPEQLIRDQRVGMWSSDQFRLDTSDAPPDFAIGKVPYPASADLWQSGVLGYGISRGTQYPEAAWRWLDYLSRQQIDRSIEEFDPASLIPARKALAEQTGYWDALDAATAAAIERALTQPATPFRSLNGNRRVSLWNPLGQALDAVLEGTSVERALAEAQSTLDAQIAAALQTPEPTPDPRPLVVELPEIPRTAEGTTTIRFAPSSMDARRLQPIVEAFNQTSTGVFVELVEPVAPGADMLDAASLATIDCFQHAGPLDAALITHTLDLQPLIDADAGFAGDDYPPALLAAYQDGTALYGLPYAVEFSLLNYNQSAFDAAGLVYPTIDWTLDDFLNVAQKLTVGTGPTRQYGYAAPVFHTPDIRFFLNRAGASLVQRQGDTLQPTLTDPAVVAAMDDYLNVLRNASPHTEIYGYRHDRANTLDALNLILAGQVGMWLVTDASSSIGQAPGVALAAAPIPLGDSRLTPNDFQVRGLHITATTPHPQACWSWIKHLSGTGEVALGQSNLFPARRSVATSAAFLAQAPASAPELFQAYIAALDQGSAPAAVPDVERMDYYWFYQAIDRALQGADLEEALAAAQATTEGFLECVHTGAAGHDCASQVDPDYKGVTHQPPD